MLKKCRRVLQSEFCIGAHFELTRESLQSLSAILNSYGVDPFEIDDVQDIEEGQMQ